MLRAFSVTCAGYPPAIYFAATASKAKAAALLQARAAGYTIKFSDLRIRRARDYDGATYCGETPTHGMRPEYLDLGSDNHRNENLR